MSAFAYFLIRYYSAFELQSAVSSVFTFKKVYSCDRLAPLFPSYVHERFLPFPPPFPPPLLPSRINLSLVQAGMDFRFLSYLSFSNLHPAWTDVPSFLPPPPLCAQVFNIVRIDASSVPVRSGLLLFFLRPVRIHTCACSSSACMRFPSFYRGAQPNPTRRRRVSSSPMQCPPAAHL